MKLFICRNTVYLTFYASYILVLFFLCCTCNTAEASSVRDECEDQASAVVGAGHAQSVSPAGGVGSLHEQPNREPECERLHLWNYCKLCVSPKISHDLFCEMIYVLQKRILL